MKTSKPNILSAGLKLLLVPAVIIFILYAVSSCAAGKKATAGQTEVAPPPPPPAAPQRPTAGQKAGDAYVVVEVMPQFPGGDKALLKFVAENTSYPKEAKDKNIQGRVIVRFIVKDDGIVSDAEVLKGVDPLLDAEAVRIVSTLPQFEPGRQGGVAVPVYFMIPITFTLRGDSPQRPSRFQVFGNDTIYTSVAEMPEFMGGDGNLQKFKAENVKYAPELKNLGVEGLVSVSFIIEKNGSVSDIKILRGASPSLDTEAIRVTKLMSTWKPASVNGKPVRFMYGTSYDFLLTPRTPPVFEEGAPFVVVEEMPMFPGGDSALLAYISQNTKYPESAKSKNIQGRVIIRFCVTSEGGVDRVTVLKGVDTELDAEAIRVVKTLPTFKPGKQGGKAVNVWYMVPITFALSNPATDGAAKPPEGSPRPEITGYDEIPISPGGEAAIYKFLNANVVYPRLAKEKNISGKVIVNCRINPDGIIDDVSVSKGVDPELDTEAMRVVRLLPQWKPGKLAGKPVNVWYQMPVTFTLK